jgi:hypothetical protein
MADGLPERFSEVLAEVSRSCASFAAGGRRVSNMRALLNSVESPASVWEEVVVYVEGSRPFDEACCDNTRASA